jgi:hypothetical protein
MLSNWVLVARDGAAGRGSGEKDQELTMGPMVAEIGVGTAPVRGLGGGRRWTPLELGHRRRGSAAGATRKRVSFRAVKCKG